ncbi:MAG: hypothetical protein Udaeo2_21350 [Candidatus Udaeobacter sp.]|nr:MAG: hypothetical protein Udaeo2_21350 [Candidatus Udaeobacter sp.]
MAPSGGSSSRASVGEQICPAGRGNSLMASDKRVRILETGDIATRTLGRAAPIFTDRLHQAPAGVGQSRRSRRLRVPGRCAVRETDAGGAAGNERNLALVFRRLKLQRSPPLHDFDACVRRRSEVCQHPS